MCLCVRSARPKKDSLEVGTRARAQGMCLEAPRSPPSVRSLLEEGMPRVKYTKPCTWSGRVRVKRVLALLYRNGSLLDRSPCL